MAILIVEDELLVARALKDVLSRAGYEVVGLAPDAETALRYGEQFRPSLALMDINLSGEFEGIKTARELQRRYGTAIIFVTAYTDRRVVDLAAALKPIAIIHKPVEAREIICAIELARANETAFIASSSEGAVAD